MSQLCSRCDKIFIAAFNIVTAPLTVDGSVIPLAYEDLPKGLVGQRFWSWEEWKSSVASLSWHFCLLLYTGLLDHNTPSSQGELQYDIEHIPKHEHSKGHWNEALLTLWKDTGTKPRYWMWDRLAKHRVTFHIDQTYNGKSAPFQLAHLGHSSMKQRY